MFGIIKYDLDIGIVLRFVEYVNLQVSPTFLLILYKWKQTNKTPKPLNAC